MRHSVTQRNAAPRSINNNQTTPRRHPDTLVGHTVLSRSKTPLSMRTSTDARHSRVPNPQIARSSNSGFANTSSVARLNSGRVPNLPHRKPDPSLSSVSVVKPEVYPNETTGESLSLVLRKNLSPQGISRDKNSLPAFYTEPTLESNSLADENQLSALENLKYVIADVLNQPIPEGPYVCPVVESCKYSHGTLESIKGYRNINHVKELNEKLTQYESENFKLKLKLFYFEEEKNKAGFSADTNQNIKLKVELQEQRLQLAKRNELLKDALLCLNSFDKPSEKTSPSKSSELTCHHDKTISEADSLTSYCATITEDSVADASFLTEDNQTLKKSFHRLMDKALSLNPEFKILYEHMKNCFNSSLKKESDLLELEEPLLLDLLVKKIKELEMDLMKVNEHESTNLMTDVLLPRETKLELSSLHQALLEKSREIQDAHREKCIFMKEAEESYKSVLAVADEKRQEVLVLQRQLKEMENEVNKMRQCVEDGELLHQKKVEEINNKMEQELKEKNRILSEEEVLDQLLSEQNEELAKLKKEVSLWQGNHDLIFSENQAKDLELHRVQTELKEVSINLDKLQAVYQNFEKENSERQKLEQEINYLKSVIKIQEESNMESHKESYKNKKFNENLLVSVMTNKTQSIKKNENEKNNIGEFRCKEAELVELRHLYKEAGNKIIILEQQLKSVNLNETSELLMKYYKEYSAADTRSSINSADPSGSYIEMKTETGYNSVRGMQSESVEKHERLLMEFENPLAQNLVLPEKSLDQIRMVSDLKITPFDQSNELSRLKEEISQLILKNQQLELKNKKELANGNTEFNKSVKYCPLQSTFWDASSIHNNSMDCSQSQLEHSSVFKILEGTDSNHFLMNHIIEFYQFMQKLLTSGDQTDLMSHEFLTPISVLRFKRAIADIDLSLDASQSGQSLLMLERTLRPLPASMNNLKDSTEDPIVLNVEPETESDGTSRDRDMSIISSNSHTKDFGESNIGDSVDKCLNEDIKQSISLKGSKNKNCKNKELESLVLRLENTLVSLSRELASFQNDNPRLILQLMDNLQGGTLTQPNFLQGQILSAFEMLGYKMDSLEKILKEVDSAAKILSSYFNIRDTSKSVDEQKTTTVKRVASPLNMTMAGESDVHESLYQELKDSSKNRREISSDEQSLENYENSLIQNLNREATSEEHAGTLTVPQFMKDSLEVFQDCCNQLVESLRSSLDWVKSVNDSELNDIVKKQGIEDFITLFNPFNKSMVYNTSGYGEELSKINGMFPYWVQLNRALIQILAKYLRDKKQKLQVAEEQVEILNKNLQVKFKDIKQVQDWNLRLQSELDKEKTTLSSALQRLSSVEEAFETASWEVKSKTEIISKLWEENALLKSSIESNVSDSAATKELCNKLEKELKENICQREQLEQEFEKSNNEYHLCQIKIENDSQLRVEYINQIQLLKEEIQHLKLTRNDVLKEKNDILSKLSSIEEKHRETEKIWLESYESLEIKFKEQITHLESMLASKERNFSINSSIEADLKKALVDKANLKEDCSLLGERLNEILKQFKHCKDKLKKQDIKNENLCKKLTELESLLQEETRGKAQIELKLKSETKARIEVEKLAISESKAKVGKLVLGQSKLAHPDTITKPDFPIETPEDQIEKFTISQYEAEDMKRKIQNLQKEMSELKSKYKDNETSLQEALIHEKEKADRYKKNFAYAKIILKQKAGISFKCTSSMSEMSTLGNEEKATEISGVTNPYENKNNFKCSHKCFISENVSTSSNDIENKSCADFSNTIPEVHQNKQSLESVILNLLVEMNFIKSDLESTMKANEKLTEQLKKYESSSDEANYKQVSSNEPLQLLNMDLQSIADNERSSVLPNSVANKPSKNDILGSSDSLLHSRVIEQLGGSINNKISAGFSCISNEVPVRDIDSDSSACNMKYMPKDFQSSNEEIQAIINGARIPNPLKSKRSTFSSPDLGIESDQNRERGSSGSPMTTSDGSQLQLSLMKPSNLVPGQNSSLSVTGRLGDLVLLNKEVEECTAILEGIRARVQGRLSSLSQRSNSTSPAKSLEYSTLKEVDSGCYQIHICLEKSCALISSFWIERKGNNSEHTLIAKSQATMTEEERGELKRLKLLTEEQSKKLKAAVDMLSGFQHRKENVDKAITKQLSKTKRVLRKAKGNLLDERKDLLKAEGCAIPATNVKTDDSFMPKQVASTPMMFK